MSKNVNKKSEGCACNKASDSHISKKGIIIICAVSLLLVAALVLGIVFSVILSKDVDYMNDNLSAYISLSEDDYKGYTLEVAYDDIRESDIARKIASLRYQKRKSALNNGGNAINLNQPIDAGDTVKIYYRGYTVDANGREQAFDGGCNFSSTPHSLGIGSLGFIPGFEESLIGAKPGDYSKLNLKKSGRVEAGDIIYLSYKAMLPDGSSVTKSSEKIDLSRADLDAEYGAGFKDYFTGANIGVKMTQNATFAMGSGSAVYFDMTVNYATGGDDNPLTIEAYFPLNYQEPTLRGATVFFDVYFEEVIAYDTPEYNEDFITKTLGISEQELLEYEGDGIVEKHMNMLRAQIAEEYKADKNTAIEEAIWKHLHAAVKVKRLPKNELDEVYYEYYGELEETYKSYSQYYSTIDEFAVAYFNISSDVDWKEYIRERAKEIVTEKLIFYYIIREENLAPSDDEYNTRYNACVQEYLDYYTENIYKDELQKITSEAEKQKKIAEIKAEMMSYYGEEYFSEIVYYQYSLDGFLALPTVVKQAAK